jgi:hypothetical protein
MQLEKLFYRLYKNTLTYRITRFSLRHISKLEILKCITSMVIGIFGINPSLQCYFTRPNILIRYYNARYRPKKIIDIIVYK